MAVFRIDKTRDYTVMSNHHLRNTSLSLKAKGLLSLMLSLPENWDYTTKGLSKICKDGIDSICSTIKELEQHGYIIRQRVRNEKGQLTTVEYTILEAPETASPKQEKPKRENPVLDNPILENPDQLNTNISNTKKSNIDLSSTNISNPIQSNPKGNSERIGMDEIDAYREIIKENIEYDILVINNPLEKVRIDEIVELLTETVCTSKEYLTIAGDDYPAALVKSKLLKLDSEHIEYVLSSLRKNTSEVRNIKKYMLAVLFNAPTTIDSFYSAQVNHDLYGG
ncbi:MAG: helix-turn-helix domain-containing protein [Ruminococcaceae bacterium]|nr:helix-turn-helix domain-containing protein [Oscillospiraceae bacterium]